MTIQELVNSLSLKVLAGSSYLTREVEGGFASDLLSHVMGQAKAGNVWVTMQGHQNIIAVASLIGLSAIIVAAGVEPDPSICEKAESEEVVLLTTPALVFETVSLLSRMGIQGR